MTRHKRHRPKLRSLYQWHRYPGLAVALLAVLLSITGVMLNHTEQLKLDQRQVHHRWLLGWYGINPVEGRFFRIGEQWLSQRGEQLYLDSTELPFPFNEELIGAVRLSGMTVAAGHSSLLLLTPDGQLIERLNTLDGIPNTIHAIAADAADHILLQTETGIHSGDLMSDDWREKETTANWSHAEAPPEELEQVLSKDYPGASLPLERIILDLHSGRLFGDWGSYVMDTAAVLLLFNAASGILIWWRRRQQHQRTRHS
jgi:hypothetical protein